TRDEGDEVVGIVPFGDKTYFADEHPGGTLRYYERLPGPDLWAGIEATRKERIEIVQRWGISEIAQSQEDSIGQFDAGARQGRGTVPEGVGDHGRDAGERLGAHSYVDESLGTDSDPGSG